MRLQWVGPELLSILQWMGQSCTTEIVPCSTRLSNVLSDIHLMKNMLIIYLNMEPKLILHINTEYSTYGFFLFFFLTYGFNIHQVSQEHPFHVIDGRGCFALFRKSTTQLFPVFEMPLQFCQIMCSFGRHSDSGKQASDGSIRTSGEVVQNFCI